MGKSVSTLATRSPALQGLLDLQAAGTREVDLDLLARLGWTRLRC
jgi:hypothetical protein